MMTSRYTQLFTSLRGRNRAALVPFLVLGHPTLELSVELAIAAVEKGGADALELGIPFSDPVADGPVIQAASKIALESGVTLGSCMEAIGAVREKIEAPIGLLTYANLVERPGLDIFYQRVAASGADSVLVADVPVFEGSPYKDAALANGVSPVFVAPPNASSGVIEQVAGMSEGYTYVVSRFGVTGADRGIGDCTSTIENLRRAGSPPPVIGFGISTPEQVRLSVSMGASGVISGSAIVSLVQEHFVARGAPAGPLVKFVKEMKAATQL